MKFNFRKIASALASTAMLGSTVALAAAASYPAPFVQNGSADVAIIYGSTAQPQDFSAASDIALDLQAALSSQAGTGGSSGVSGGDFVKIAKSSDNLNLGNTMSGVFGNTIDDGDLPDLLADGTYLNDENTEYNFEQRISLYPRQLTFFADSDYEDKEPTIGFQISSNTNVMNYSIDFTTDAESDVGSSGDLTDFETTDINLMGKQYYILDAQNGTSSTYFGKFTLLDSANHALLSEGDTQSMTIGSTTYEVSISFISSTQVKLDVNGEVTNSLGEGETFRLSDGTYVGIKDILYNSKDNGISQVDFSIGSGKIEIEAGSDIELNDDSISGMKGYVFRGSASSSKQRLDKIVIEWKTDDEMFIAPGSDLVMPAFEAVKFSMGSFFTPEKEITTVDFDGDDSIELTVPIRDGDANLNILYAGATGYFTGIGKDSDEQLATSYNGTLLYNVSTATTNVHRWFVATYNSSSDGESYLLSATVTEKDARNRTTIKNEVTGQDVCEDKIAGDSCNIGDVTLNINQVYKDSTGIKWVRFTAGSGTNFKTLFTTSGLNILLPFEINSSDNSGSGNNTRGQISFLGANSTAGHNATSFYLYFDEENKDDDLAAGNSFNVTLTHDSDGDVHVSDIDAGNEIEVPDTSDDTIATVSSDLATQVTRLVSSDRGSAQIEYHGSESYAEVFLTDMHASVGSSDGSTDLGTVSYKDSDVGSVSSKNMIVVGGSCVNTVASRLLNANGSPLCGADFEAATGVGSGGFLIQTFTSPFNTAKVATLVAGYNAEDTTKAAAYLTTNPIMTDAGKKYTGVTATNTVTMVSG